MAHSTDEQSIGSGKIRDVDEFLEMLGCLPREADSGQKGKLATLNTICLVGHTSDIRSMVLSGSVQPERFLGTELLDIKPSVRFVSGSIENCFGTVQLAIEPGSILNDRHIYLSDLDHRSGTPLCRMVVSSEELHSKKHKRVEPSKPGGPLYQAYPGGAWAGRGGCDYEFLFDSSCALSLFKSISFNMHNGAYCFRYGDFCRQSNPDQSVCELVALAIARPDLNELTSLIRSARFIVSSQLLVPFGIWLRQLERTFPVQKEDVSEFMLQEAFLKLGMGNAQGAIEILSRAEREQTNQFLLRGLERVLGYRPTDLVELYLN